MVSAGVLNLFGGVLIYKRKAEETLERSGVPYVIVRPGGMERPRDDYKATHNVRLSTRDTLFGGQVSRLQVAELVSTAVGNAALAENKVQPSLMHIHGEGVASCGSASALLMNCQRSAAVGATTNAGVLVAGARGGGGDGGAAARAEAAACGPPV